MTTDGRFQVWSSRSEGGPPMMPPSRNSISIGCESADSDSDRWKLNERPIPCALDDDGDCGLLNIAPMDPVVRGLMAFKSM
jgi:hypothetical protein